MKYIALVLCLFVVGCNITQPQTLGQQSQDVSYGYTPLDPLPVNIGKQGDVLSLFPNTTMRLAIGSFDSTGNITYGPIKIALAGNRYQVVLDYIQYTTLSIPVSVKITPLSDEEAKRTGKKVKVDVNILPDDKADTADKIVPIYVGIGLRLTADVTVLKNSIDLSNLVAIGAAATNNELYGTLTVQAMGISGETVSETLPVPGTLDQSTIQQAMMALGTIKSKSYSKDSKIELTPQVVAVYNPFANSNPQVVSGLIGLILLDQPSLGLQKAIVTKLEDQKQK